MMLLPDLPPAVEGIRHQQENIRAFMNQTPMGDGKLVIAESHVTWVKEGSESGLSLEYPHIVVHAISRDLSSFSFPCLYLMIDVALEQQQQQDDDAESDNEDEAEWTEIRFVPADPMALEPMHKAINDCLILHPNPEDVQSDEEDYFGEEIPYGNDALGQNGQNGHQLPAVQDDMDGDGDGEEEEEEDDAMETGQFDDA